MTTNQAISNEQEIAKFFETFELTTEYREIRYSDDSLLQQLPRLLRGVIKYQFLPYYFSDVPKWRLMVRSMMSKKRIAPNYVMTGPGKSGSSDIVSHLLLHPNVMAPLAKEVRLHKHKNWRMYYPTVSEMRAMEEKVGGPVKCGYLDPVLNKMQVMETLYDLNPNCKVIITLRDPVDRAYSHWKWDVLMGGQRLRNNKKFAFFQNYSEYMERALDLFPGVPMETVCGYQPLGTGIYNKAVKQWFKRFGRENVMVLDVAEYFQNRQPVLEKIQNFLELPVVSIPEYGKKANANPIKLPPPEPKIEAALAEFYRPYNESLYELIGTEFNWK